MFLLRQLGGYEWKSESPPLYIYIFSFFRAHFNFKHTHRLNSFQGRKDTSRGIVSKAGDGRRKMSGWIDCSLVYNKADNTAGQ